MITKSYLDWEPALTAKEVFQQSVGFSFLSSNPRGDLFWIESRPEEAGRCVLMMRDTFGETREITPAPFSARTRVMEYGGYPYAVTDDSVFFTHMKDQRIYHVNLKDKASFPVARTTEKTREGALAKYMELCVSPDGRWLAFALEKEVPSVQSDHASEPLNEIGLIDLNILEVQDAQTLAEGANFYKSPKFSPDGKSLAWLEWDHPFMPWDSTRAMEASFQSGRISETRKVAGGDQASISCLAYAPNGELLLAMDHAQKSEKDCENYYNIYAAAKGALRTLTRELRDIQHFRIGKSALCILAYDKGIAQHLSLEFNSNATLKSIPMQPVSFSLPVPCGDHFYCVGTHAKAPAQILEVQKDGAQKVIKESSSTPVQESNISECLTLQFPTSDGEISHGFFYPPKNSQFIAPEHERPPVRVLVHGGPTGMTQPGFSKQLLFWTSQGYAVFDVNYRGSFGFGRKYRDALLKKWGVLEIQDVRDGLKFLRENNYISDKAVVSGGSAGGYTVQRLLTFYPDLFSTGASHFGIGNLVTLQKLTHKYESHYLEQLIGGTLENNLPEYENRSPINHLQHLKCPMIIFQGSEDKVVPPENSREMAEILKSKGIPYEYYEFPEEAHGFRKKENLITALEKEAQFFKKTLKSRGLNKNTDA